MNHVANDNGLDCASPYHNEDKCPRCREAKEYENVFYCPECGLYFKENKEVAEPIYTDVDEKVCESCNEYLSILENESQYVINNANNY